MYYYNPLSTLCYQVVSKDGTIDKSEEELTNGNNKLLSLKMNCLLQICKCKYLKTSLDLQTDELLNDLFSIYSSMK